MKTFLRSTPALVVGLAVLLLVTTTGGAVAGSLITSAQIQDGTVTSADIRNKTITAKDLAKSARGLAGPVGPAGPPGAAGVAGARGLSAWDTIPSGTTVTGEFQWDHSATGGTNSDFEYVALPGRAPAGVNDSTVNFKPALVVEDPDATCTGTNAVPTAPPGKVCLYLVESGGMTNVSGSGASLTKQGFLVRWIPDGAVGEDMFITVTWAFTAP